MSLSLQLAYRNPEGSIDIIEQGLSSYSKPVKLNLSFDDYQRHYSHIELLKSRQDTFAEFEEFRERCEKANEKRSASEEQPQPIGRPKTKGQLQDKRDQVWSYMPDWMRDAYNSVEIDPNLNLVIDRIIHSDTPACVVVDKVAQVFYEGYKTLTKLAIERRYLQPPIITSHRQQPKTHDQNTTTPVRKEPPAQHQEGH